MPELPDEIPQGKRKVYGTEVLSSAAARALADRSGPRQVWWLSFATPTRLVGVIVVEEVNGHRATLKACRNPAVAALVAGTECDATPVPEDQVKALSKFMDQFIRGDDTKTLHRMGAY